ncbi:hypothetical protein [Candidatus Nitrosotenuis aquarius]|uniref:hypothetical protein n=1 Tax=Candidatus Nitrosotenuis aquarius TaxID=1846278 RepID=UPI000C1EFBE8|nr:hypothetical protein [Candidatus Nitrosotenuis aquarius]
MKSVLLFALAVMPGIAFAQIQVQHTDIAELMMKKHQITVEDTGFTIFYRFSTVGEGESSNEDTMAQITSVDINKERKSLVISIDDINQDDLMSVRFSEELVSAQGKRLVLLIDGGEKGYESNTQDGKRTMIFVLPEGSKQVEIVGTRVIPEFPSAALALAAIVSSVVLVQKLRKN